MKWSRGDVGGGMGNVEFGDELSFYLFQRRAFSIPVWCVHIAVPQELTFPQTFCCYLIQYITAHLSTFSLDNLSQSPSEAIITTSSSVSLLLDKSNFLT